MFLGIVISCINFVYGSAGGLCLESFLFSIDNLLSFLTDSNSKKPLYDAEAVNDILKKISERVYERSNINEYHFFTESEDFRRASMILLNNNIHGDPISVMDKEFITRVMETILNNKYLMTLNKDHYVLGLYLDYINTENLNNYYREVARIIIKMGDDLRDKMYYQSISWYMDDLFDENIHCYINGENIEELNPYMSGVKSVYILEEIIMELTDTEKIVIENIEPKLVYLNGEYICVDNINPKLVYLNDESIFIKNIYRFVNNEKIEKIYTDFPSFFSGIVEKASSPVCYSISPGPSPYFDESKFLQKEGILNLDLDALEYYFW